MPRKKVKNAKVAKKTVKTKRKLESLTEAMEKSFREIPGKIAVQAEKDIASKKQQESKLQSSLQKMQKQQKTIKNKQTTLTSKEKLSPTGKKQLKLSNKAFDLINKSIADVLRQIDVAKEDVKVLSSRQAKYSALKKELLRIEKEWDKLPAKPKKSRKSTQKKSVSEQITQDSVSLEPVTNDNASESADLNSQ